MMLADCRSVRKLQATRSQKEKGKTATLYFVYFLLSRDESSFPCLPTLHPRSPQTNRKRFLDKFLSSVSFVQTIDSATCLNQQQTATALETSRKPWNLITLPESAPDQGPWVMTIAEKRMRFLRTTGYYNHDNDQTLNIPHPTKPAQDRD